jgi:hypothetical protein
MDTEETVSTESLSPEAIEELGLGTIEVTPDDAEHDETETSEEPEEPRPRTRQERRNARVAQFREETERARRELEQERQERQALQQRIAHLEGRVQEQYRQRPDAPDPTLAERERLVQARMDLEREFLDLPESERRAKEKHYRLRAEMEIEAPLRQLDARETVRRHVPTPDPAELQARQLALQEEFADVVKDPEALAEAQRRFIMATQRGEPATETLARKSYLEARKWRNGAGPDVPRERQMTGGMTAARSGASRSNGAVQMTREMRLIAQMHYPGKPKEEAWKLWAKNDHSAYAERQRENREARDRREKP